MSDVWSSYMLDSISMSDSHAAAHLYPGLGLY